MAKRSFSNVDLNLLRVFAAVMLERNVTRAAVHLHLSQSAVSNAMQRLRDTFEDELFQKTAHGVRPTARARQIWSALEPHYVGLRGAFEADDFDPSTFEGRISIAISDYTAEVVLPALMEAVAREAPGMRIACCPFQTVDLGRMFEVDGVDFAIGTLVSDLLSGTGIRRHHLLTFEACCVMHVDHPLAQGDLTLGRFLEARHIDVCLPGAMEPLYDTLLEARGLHRKVVFTTHSVLTLFSLLAQGDSVGMVPRGAASRSIHASVLSERSPPIVPPERPVYVFWRELASMGAAHRWLLGKLTSLPLPVAA